jgi:uncharacterized membrane protein YfcA
MVQAVYEILFGLVLLDDGFHQYACPFATAGRRRAGRYFGCLAARKVPAEKLKAVIAAIAICAGLQLVWSGARSLAAKQTTNTARMTAVVHGAARP